MTYEVEEKIRASTLADYEVGDAFDHLDAARQYTNPINEVSWMREEYNLRHGEAAKLFKAWTDTFMTDESRDDFWDKRVYPAMEILAKQDA